MVLPASGAISLSNVNVELGRSATASINMNESDVRTLADKASGAVAMSDLYGKGVSLSNLYISSTGGNAQTARYTLESDGDIISETTDGGIIDQGDWINPKTAAPGTYEVRATLAQGDPPTTGTLNTWLALTSNRTWTMSVLMSGNQASGDLTIEIRRGSSPVIASATITLYAERF